MSEWTDAQKAEAAEMWAAGISCRKIAAHFGISRNAAMGRLHRMGAKTPVTQSNYRNHVATQPRALAKVKPLPPPPIPEPSTETAVTTLDLAPGQCKWPTTADVPFLHCGAPAVEWRPYCPHHLARAFSAGTYSERSVAA